MKRQETGISEKQREGRISDRPWKGALPAAFFLGQRNAGLRLKEMGELAGGFEYPAVNAAIARFREALED